MGERIEEFEYKDEDGDSLRIRYTSRSCMCCGGCYPDTLEVEDYPGANEFFSMDIECAEIRNFITDMIEANCRKI
jgi:hypothetical protein